MTGTAVLATIVGLALLLGSGEALLNGAVRLAQRLGLSQLLIGLTVVAAATSMPELVVVVAAGMEGVPDLGVGNVIGSNIANILLILGVAACMVPVVTGRAYVMRDGLTLLLATTVFVVFAYLGYFRWVHGLVMLALLAGYIVFSYRQDRRDYERAKANGQADSGPKPTLRQTLVAGLLVALGCAGLALGSHLLIKGSVEIARWAGISDAVIGISLVAVGTSLPELATVVVAGLRKRHQIALGNVLGSNLFNTLGILGALALTGPFAVRGELLHIDAWIMVAVTIGLMTIMLLGKRIGRVQGAAFLLLYVTYIGYRFLDSSGAGPAVALGF